MSHRFVVHEHHSSHLHFDFRLEMGGVLRSWAIPKGPSMVPGEKRLAIEVENHPLEYIDFEGIIPEGMYGAGAVVIWDAGTYELMVNERDKIEIIMSGKKLRGEFDLVRFKSKGKENQWLLIKHKDRYASLDWKLEACLTQAKLSKLKERIPPCAFS
ncbi:MAG: DNA polymerase ligase N-terminal domain-containing protein [Thermodesulfobacteriota bacterium]